MDKAQGKVFRELPNTTLCDCGHPKTAHYQGEGCCEGCGCTWYHPNIGVIDMLKAGYRKLPEGEPPLLSKLQVTKVLLDKYPGFDPEFDIDYDATEVTNQAQRDSDIKWVKGGGK